MSDQTGEHRTEQPETVTDPDVQIRLLRLEVTRLGHKNDAIMEQLRGFIDANVALIVNNTLLAEGLEATTTRLAEVLDQNQLLRDDAAETPVPFTIVEPVTGSHLQAVPSTGVTPGVPAQRAVGDQA